MKKYITILLVFVSIFLFSACGKSNKNIFENTSWTGDGGSLLEFKKDNMYWYQDGNEKNQNYYAAKYKYFSGEKAIDYLVNDLKDYGITRSEINQIITANNEYTKDNLVVFDFDFYEFDLYGEKQEIPNSHIAWVGFLLDDGTYLDVANMNTGSYYGFTKNTK